MLESTETVLNDQDLEKFEHILNDPFVTLPDSLQP